MDRKVDKKQKTPQEVLRDVMRLCADCDTCRTMMEEDCAFFIELYRLVDQEQEEGIPITESQLRYLAELCTLCGLCPCPKVPMDVMEAKTRYVEREGLPLATRLLNDVPRMARLCGTFPRLVKAMQENKILGPLLRKATRIHPDRQWPSFPQQNFFKWAAAKGLDKPQNGDHQVAYFVGCTAGYLFPQIGRSVVEILQHNGANVYVPPQQCCGMPFLVEGDRNRTLQLARTNMEKLLESVRGGDDLIYSCPTCGFFLKRLLKDRAYYSDVFQKSVNAVEGELKVPAPEKGENQFWHLKKSMYHDILKDDGYFSSIDPMDRIQLADHLFDFGIYLARLHAEGKLATDFAPLPERMAYFAPCHLREQKMGRPYLDLLKMVPGLDIEEVGSDYDCCGMGGIFGFKEHFHQKSLDLGAPLMKKIRAHDPQAIVTDCMSCRLQFSHCLPYPVYHPVEVLARAYRSEGSQVNRQE
ncbi:iron-sulfur cluster-binding oxidoreductase, CCG domain pair-containing [Syntrophotalea carbinolica DSM 2380]|uniref:Iron-sulfur cluster-binding oxidoreductase, CCG domain pair-containing n=1 Tax=Syntrophotalea carbinolica (strain DSM 2380 / NBRC 103641 / GraBd1) TaxID=338963 RepID=Q3A8I1_SYNC1|nr:heterodisulfide reductase-related iron-sulfur binding cluster [Syntrophotalea carbinolica]ABA87311.1 iron-sulfur cluster-binding oxidoreductase, CCG domain pair-containing [Syntrophotalea carbinolica DSM 2380]